MRILDLLWPTFALVAVIIVVWSVLVAVRVRHLRRTPPRRDTFATGASALAYFEPVELPANNLRNLFEMPMLYFALVPLLIVTAQASIAQVVLAWLFVLSRATHSVLHIGGKVPARAMVYWLSSGILIAMWVGYFVDMVQAAGEYHRAMEAIGARR